MPPSVSQSQQRAAQAAEHMSEDEIAKAGPAVKQMAEGMSKQQLHEFASGPMKHKPKHVHHHPKEKRGDGRSAGRSAKGRGDYEK